MSDQSPINARDDPAQACSAHYDLVIVGAGIAGLNALHAATLFLPKSARVLLIDAKDAAGGMWNETYDYVRLHQPHPLFTVAGMRWKWRKPPDYLATRDEVKQHLAQCLQALRQRLDLELRFGHAVSAVTELRRSGVWKAEVVFHDVADPDRPITVEADRVIHAAGFDVQPLDRLALSSQAVLSTTPSSLMATLDAHPDAPVHVVGGGKTGMDTILAVRNRNTGRTIVLINGEGTYYLNRTRYFPTGLGRWFGGALAAGMFHDCAMRFDGHNEDEIRAHFIATYAVDHDPRSRNFIYGVMSEDESRRVEAGLAGKIWDYLEDVADGPTGPVMRLRSGAEIPVPQGSIFVNCTGSLLRRRSPERPQTCLSEHDTILSINMHDAMHVLTTYSSFILSHLYLSGRLRQSRLYFLNLEALYGSDKPAFAAATMTQSYHNVLMALKNLPTSSRRHFAMDFNRWYPLPRRLLALRDIRRTARDDIRHCRASLDAVKARFGIAGGQLA